MHRWNEAQDNTSSNIIKKTLNLIPYGNEIEMKKHLTFLMQAMDMETTQYFFKCLKNKISQK